MIKKLSLSLVFTFIAFGAFSQTIVSTSPENKNVILEEYTGIHCGFCPQGHAIAQGLKESNPEDFYVINIHVGGYAVPGSGEPDFRTPFGTAIANESGVSFYPAGSVNRHVFSGGVSAMGRSDWNAATNVTLEESSFVNVGVEATIDVATSILTVHVEGYYTGDSPESSNLLNIALLQNNTTGPQSGGGMGNNYNHQHRLVHMVTGQWGEPITSTTAGTLVDETFTYTIPADYNDIATVLDDMEIVAFITNTHQEIASGSGTIPTFINLPLENDANVESIEEIEDQCGLDFGPKVNIQNRGNNLLTSLDFEYSINSGATETFTWNGSIESYHYKTIQLPAIAFDIQSSNTVIVSIGNDEDNSNNDTQANFSQITDTNTNIVSIHLNTDDTGNETTWEVIDPNGDIVANGGPYDNNVTIDETFTLHAQGCHMFSISDAGGNGSGSVVVYDTENSIIFQSNGDYEAGGSSLFVTEATLGLETDQLNNLVIYPNPASSILNIDNAENSTIEVYDLLGRVVLSRTNISLKEQLNVSTLNSGTYLIRITNENKIVTDKFIINR